MNKYCIICKTDKNISNFVKTRNECISCRQKIIEDKFKQGPFIYVFESFGRYSIGKVGKIDTNEEKFSNLNVHLFSHRCIDPNLIIKYIIYSIYLKNVYFTDSKINSLIMNSCMICY